MLANKTAEKDIRDFLNDRGYYGRTARFEEIELHAVQRPGWLQIIRFSVRAKSVSRNEWVMLFGVMKDDERFKLCDIRCFEKLNQRWIVMEKWSEGLTRPAYSASEGRQFSIGRTALELVLFAALIAAALGMLSLLS